MIKPIDFGLPEKFTEYREGQLEISAKVAASDKFCYMLDAPTGIGKSLIAATIQRLMGKKILYLCLTANNTVLTESGRYIPISEVQVGNYVQTGPGQHEKVYAIGSKPYLGYVMRIETAYHTDEELEVTPEHEVLAVKSCSKQELFNAKREMISAGDIRNGDWLAYPSYTFCRANRVTSHDSEYTELSAWYVTEGWIGGNNQVFFSLSDKETENVARVAYLLSKISGHKVGYDRSHKSTVVVYAYSPKLCALYDMDFGRGATKKRLPAWIFTSDRDQRELFLDTLCEGDGSIIRGSRAKSYTVEIGTSSRQLALGIRQLALQNGYLPSISTRDYPVGTKIMGREINAHRGYILRYRHGTDVVKDARGVNTCEWVYLKVLKVEKVRYKGFVYDISVPSERFCTASATVHNCTTKQLQDQLLHDFPYARTLKGRANYPCLNYKSMYPRITAEECTKSETSPCDLEGQCPYMVAKKEALGAPLAVLNNSYFLTEANFIGTFSDQDMIVVDEADTLEDHLMSFVDVTVTQKQLNELQLEEPRYKTKFESWVEWAKTAVDILRPRLNSIRNELESSWSTTDFDLMREEKKLSRLMGKLTFFIKEVDKNWVWYPQQTQWSFKPVWVAKYAENSFWKHAKKVLMMSATILDYTQVSRNVGLDVMKVSYKALPSPFPKENRPIYLDYAASVSNKTMQEALPKLVEKIRAIMNEHPDDKILVHCVTYKIRDYLTQFLDKKRIMTHSTFDRVEVLESFKNSTHPRVLLSPSMDRGVDLPDDQCRVVIIAKIPFGDLGDPQISKRVHASKDGNIWYAHKAISKIIQMSGRAVRSKDDYADTYILDEQFDRVFTDNRRMFPQWFREAIVR